MVEGVSPPPRVVNHPPQASFTIPGSVSGIIPRRDCQRLQGHTLYNTTPAPDPRKRGHIPGDHTRRRTTKHHKPRKHPAGIIPRPENRTPGNARKTHYTSRRGSRPGDDPHGDRTRPEKLTNSMQKSAHTQNYTKAARDKGFMRLYDPGFTGIKAPVLRAKYRGS